MKKGNAALSLKELNLILEAERVRRVQRPGRYREVLEYIEDRGFDRRGTAKIYPRAVYFLYKSLASGGGEDNRDEADIGRGSEEEWSRDTLLRYCNKALEALRNNGRMYYILEILDMRGGFLEALHKELQEESVWRWDGDSRTSTMERLSQENREWKRALEEIYEEFRVPRETLEYCYLYVVKGGELHQ